MPRDAAQERVARLPLWTLSDDATAISRTFVAKDFTAGLDFLQSVGGVAEERNHHPDLHLTDWRTVRLVLSTHSVGGLTTADFDLAAAFDTIPVVYSPKWAAKRGL